MSTPKIISVDDHVLEPGDLWQRYLPERFRDDGPRLVRLKGRFGSHARSRWREDEDGQWADVWVFGDVKMEILPGFAAAGKDQDYLGEHWEAMTYEDMRPGCYDRTARLADMDANHTEAGLSFPTFPRFCGQTFHECADRDLGLACVQAYNDWMIDEWCADEAYGRLIPLTLIPLWDPELAAAEIRRCAAKGSHAVCFSENPAKLKLPSIHTDHWDPLFAACEDTDTVLNLHIGSSSTFPMTSVDAPRAVSLALTYQGAAHAFADWLTSGVLERFQELRVALSEGQIGWMPFILERLDSIWEQRPVYGNLNGRLSCPPSSYVRDRIYGCVFDDAIGLTLRHRIGMKQIMFETDYPHGDSTWPNSKVVFEKIVAAADLNADEAYLLARGNAIRCYRLGRYGITE
ncbi:MULTISPECIES: amidohydrolase family protein [unclassified Frankia]|uniref:amidohydrolase family protein n=1 Tax=unclassified Frankia TaxID=2632575 RepID=UPI001EF52AA0|nr:MULTISPECIES: amidohydrolase family protein [unclassified Frankia]